MEITWLGHSCFKITGKNISVVTDPFDSREVGYQPIKTSANIITISHDHYDHNKKSVITGLSKDEKPIVFDTPGEYEVRESIFLGILSYHDDRQGEERGDNTIFIFEIDSLRVCHLGDLGCDLSDSQLEQIGDIDILLIPIGGDITINAKEAAKIISEIEPKIVIPMHYKTNKLKSPIAKDLSDLDKFLQEMGVKSEKRPKLKISKRDLPEEMEVVILEC